jgi:hypothetical protein
MEAVGAAEVGQGDEQRLRLQAIDFEGVLLIYRTKLVAKGSFRVSMAGTGVDVPCPLHLVACALPNAKFVGSGACFEGSPQLGPELTVSSQRQTNTRTGPDSRIAIPPFDMDIRPNGIISVGIRYDPALDQPSEAAAGGTSATPTLHGRNVLWLFADLFKRIVWVGREARTNSPPLRMQAAVMSYNGKARPKTVAHLFEDAAQERTTVENTTEYVDELNPHAATFQSFRFTHATHAAAELVDHECADGSSVANVGAFGMPAREAHTHQCLRAWSPPSQWDAAYLGTLRPSAERVAGNVRQARALNDTQAMDPRERNRQALARRAEREAARREQLARQRAGQEDEEAAAEPAQRPQWRVAAADANEPVHVAVDGKRVAGTNGVGAYDYTQTIHRFWGNYPTDMRPADEVVAEEDCLLQTTVTATTKTPVLQPARVGAIVDFLKDNPTLSREPEPSDVTKGPVALALDHLTTMLEYTCIAPLPVDVDVPAAVAKTAYVRFDSKELRRLAHLLGLRTSYRFNVQRAFAELNTKSEYTPQAREVALLCAIVYEQLTTPPYAGADPDSEEAEPDEDEKSALKLAKAHPLCRLLARLATRGKAGWEGAGLPIDASWTLTHPLAPMSSTVEIRVRSHWALWKSRQLAVGVSRDVFFQAMQRALVRCFYKPNVTALQAKHKGMEEAMRRRFGIGAGDDQAAAADATQARQAQEGRDDAAYQENFADDDDYNEDGENAVRMPGLGDGYGSD